MAVVSNGVDASFGRASVAKKAKGFFTASLEVITDSQMQRAGGSAWRPCGE